VNVVFIMNDTWRYDHVGAHGNDWIHTPVLDQFAKESAIFDRCYIGSFATVPCRHDLIKGRFGEPFHDWGPLEWEALTLPEVLRESGIVSMLINDTPHLINFGYGFDRPFHAWEMIRGNEVDRLRTDYFEKLELSDVTKFRSSHGMAQWHRQAKDRLSEDDYCAPRVMKAVSDWLERNAGHDEFFLWVDSFDPHEPWDPPQHYIDRYAPGYEGHSIFWPQYGKSSEMFTSKEQEHIGHLFAAECTMADNHIGRVLEKIDNLGLRENTMVVIMSDHGHYFGEHDQQSKSGPLYEEVSHQMLMIRHPEGLGAGKRFQALVQPADFAPTILDAMGVDVPEAMNLQGESWLQLLRGEKRSLRRVAISGEKPRLIEDLSEPQANGYDRPGWTSVTVTGKDYALVDFPEPERRALYHLPSDIGMLNDVIGDHLDEAEKLHAEHVRFLRRNKAPRWQQRLWRDGPEGIVAPEKTEFVKYVDKRGRPLSATPQDGNVVSIG